MQLLNHNDTRRRSPFRPLVSRRAVAAVKRDFGEDLSELATLTCFFILRARSAAALHGEQHRKSPEGTTYWGRLLFGYSSLGGARESNQPRVCHPEIQVMMLPIPIPAFPLKGKVRNAHCEVTLPIPIPGLPLVAPIPAFPLLPSSRPSPALQGKVRSARSVLRFEGETCAKRLNVRR